MTYTVKSVTHTVRTTEEGDSHIYKVLLLEDGTDQEITIKSDEVLRYEPDQKIEIIIKESQTKVTDHVEKLQEGL